ncbi:MAG: hypothetical protein P1P76_10865 [Anaerolineales bacterium]|nr:hypothetical protein [Anaerolineales bacterium]
MLRTILRMVSSRGLINDARRAVSADGACNTVAINKPPSGSLDDTEIAPNWQTSQPAPAEESEGQNPPVYAGGFSSLMRSLD